MFNRRVFIKISLCGAGLMMVNPFRLLTDEAYSQTPTVNKRFLFGNPYSGCSTPINSPDFIPDIHSGISQFEEYASAEMIRNGGNC
jgi:hypothetical protein